MIPCEEQGKGESLRSARRDLASAGPLRSARRAWRQYGSRMPFNRIEGPLAIRASGLAPPGPLRTAVEAGSGLPVAQAPLRRRLNICLDNSRYHVLY